MTVRYDTVVHSKEKAKILGLKTYRNKKGCKKGHFLFYISGNCVACTYFSTWKRREPIRKAKLELKIKREFIKNKFYRARENFNYSRYRRFSTNSWYAIRMRATPAWANRTEIYKIYDECAYLNSLIGPRSFHVDHIVPLQGKNVCGLHVEYNLRIITAKENWVKNNRFIEKSNKGSLTW